MLSFKFRRKIEFINWLKVIIMGILFLKIPVGGDKGHFWHITDLHLDLDYSPPEWHCLGAISGSSTTLGEYGCDSPLALADSALNAMRKFHDMRNVEFVLWTGDSLTESSRNISKAKSLEIMRTATLLFRRYFEYVFVFPAIGHTDLPIQDASLFVELTEMWYHWLPVQAVETFQKGGYYSIEQKFRQLRIVVLNSNLMMLDGDPYGQWNWFEDIMKNAEPNGETIYLVAHIPPGFAELGVDYAPKCALPDKQNLRFINLIKRYSHVITGQFYGHLHSDTFRIFYDIAGRPATYAFSGAPVTPKDGANPGVRLYEFDINAGQIFDYKQYYLDLKNVNLRLEPNWALEYELKSYYNITAVTPQQLHVFKENWLQQNGSKNFEKYFTSYNSKGTIQNCGKYTVWRHYCAVSYVEHSKYNDCLAEKRQLINNCPKLSKRLDPILENVTKSGISSIFLTSYYLALIFQAYVTGFWIQYLDSVYLLLFLILFVFIYMNADKTQFLFLNIFT